MSPPKSSSSAEHEHAGCLETIRGICNRLDIPWAVAGALAAMRYRATERPTADVDLLIQDSEGLVGALIDEGFDVQTFADEGLVHLIRARRSDCTVDIMLPVTEYQEIALGRATKNVLTVEDVIIHKLIAGRPRDNADIASILTSGVRLNRKYVEHWANEWDVADRWTAFLERK
jgi:hypothetical protein